MSDEIEQEIETLKARIKELNKELAKEVLGIPSPECNQFWSINGSGYPVKYSCWGTDRLRQILNCFSSEASAITHRNMTVEWRQGLLNKKRKKPISYKSFFSLLKKGFIAMDFDGTWHWFDAMPKLDRVNKKWEPSPERGECLSLSMFDIEPMEDYAWSITEIGG